MTMDLSPEALRALAENLRSDAHGLTSIGSRYEAANALDALAAERAARADRPAAEERPLMEEINDGDWQAISPEDAGLATRTSTARAKYCPVHDPKCRGDWADVCPECGTAAGEHSAPATRTTSTDAGEVRERIARALRCELPPPALFSDRIDAILAALDIPARDAALAVQARNTIEKLIRDHPNDADSDQFKRQCKALADTICGLSVDELIGKKPV